MYSQEIYKWLRNYITYSAFVHYTFFYRMDIIFTVNNDVYRQYNVHLVCVPITDPEVATPKHVQWKLPRSESHGTLENFRLSEVSYKYGLGTEQIFRLSKVSGLYRFRFREVSLYCWIKTFDSQMPIAFLCNFNSVTMCGVVRPSLYTMCLVDNYDTFMFV